MLHRDTHVFAQKQTYIEIGETGIEIFKDPITDDGIKKRTLKVYKDENNIID
jgi:hypothetical protein